MAYFNIFYLKVGLTILKQFMLPRYFVVSFKMVNHLSEVIAQSLKVDLFGDRCPPKMKMRRCRVWNLIPVL